MTPAVLDLEETPVTASTARLLDAGPLTEDHAGAWEKYQSLPLPARTDEPWRFSNLKALDLATYTAAQPIDDATREELVSRSQGIAASAGRMIFGLSLIHI